MAKRRTWLGCMAAACLLAMPLPARSQTAAPVHFVGPLADPNYDSAQYSHGFRTRVLLCRGVVQIVEFWPKRSGYWEVNNLETLTVVLETGPGLRVPWRFLWEDVESFGRLDTSQRSGSITTTVLP